MLFLIITRQGYNQEVILLRRKKVRLQIELEAEHHGKLPDIRIFEI